MGSWKYKSDKPPERDGVETFGSHEKGTFCEAGTFNSFRWRGRQTRYGVPRYGVLIKRFAIPRKNERDQVSSSIRGFHSLLILFRKKRAHICITLCIHGAPLSSGGRSFAGYVPETYIQQEPAVSFPYDNNKHNVLVLWPALRFPCRICRIKLFNAPLFSSHRIFHGQ